MRLLSRRVALGQHRSGLPQSEAQLAEQALALTHPQVDPVFPLDPRGQGFSIPEIHAHSRIARLAAQRAIDLPNLSLSQPTRTPRPFALPKSRQTLLLEAPDPILDGPRRIP